ncbi:MAG TPA: ABC transporter ATP-binding protein [Terriglobales bacterium]|nr:ABC transporter ATP-binding protein [Terriglobales bacterium]
MNSAIRTHDLSKRFRRVEAVHGLNLEVPEGAIFALVGPNGAGKTTAIKVLMNILRPSAGRAEILGLDSVQLAGRPFTAIGYVSENQELPGWMTIGYFLRYLRAFYPNWDSGLEADLVRQFQLPLDRKLKHLSRGMRMKAALAGALAYHPKLIVLDEPFSGLDPLVRDELIESMLERASECTILLSSHDLAEIESFATHVGYLEAGRLKFAEEMTSLADRFREVELTLSRPVTLSQCWPESWLQVDASPAVVRFVESRFDPEKTTSEIQRAFAEVRDVSFNPMSLRSIFLAIAKGQREAEEAKR